MEQIALATSRRSSAPKVSGALGLLPLLLFTLVLVGRTPEVVPSLTALRIPLFAGALAAFAWLVAPGSLRDKVPVHVAAVKYLVALLGLAVVSIPLGVWPGHSFDFLTGTYWKLVLLFLMLIFFCRGLKEIRWVIWACCLGSSALVVAGLLNVGGGQKRFDATSLTYDSNDLAFLLAMMLPLTVYLISASRVVSRVLLLTMVVTYLYGIVLSESRGGFLALIAAGALILRGSTFSRSLKGAIAGLAFLVLGGFASSAYWERIGTIWAPETEYDRTAGGRTEIWETGLMLMLTHPWGVGVAGFDTAEGLSHGGQGKWSAAHNSFLQIGTELGIAGLVVFLLLISRVIRDLRRIQSLAKEHTPRRTSARNPLPGAEAGTPVNTGTPKQVRAIAKLAGALETTLWVFIVGGFFLSQAYSGVLYVVLALGVCCRQLYESTLKARETIATSEEVGEAAGSAVPC